MGHEAYPKFSVNLFSSDLTDKICNEQLGSCESFFLRSNRISNRIGRRIRFRIESAVYTTQAVTPSNELQGAPCRRTVWATSYKHSSWLPFLPV